LDWDFVAEKAGLKDGKRARDRYNQIRKKTHETGLENLSQASTSKKRGDASIIKPAPVKNVTRSKGSGGKRIKAEPGVKHKVHPDDTESDEEDGTCRKLWT